MFRGIVLALGLTTLAGHASAHHGISPFNHDKDIEISGTISEVAFVNPHAWIYVDVEQPNGETVTWGCEMRAAIVLRRSGWSADMFETGETVTITGSPHREEPHTCYLGTIILADGTSMNRYGQLATSEAVDLDDRPKETKNGKPYIAGDWAAEQYVMTDPRGQEGAFLPLSEAEKLEPGAVPDGAEPIPGAAGTEPSKDESFGAPRPVELTAAGKEAAKDFDPESKDNPRFRCEPTNILNDWTFEYDVNRIIQTEDTIVLKYGFMDIERIIHLNFDDHPEDIQPSRSGHSIGHWENGVLIVDTVGFKPGVLAAGSKTMHSDALHVRERFIPDLEDGTLKREYVAEDPKYWKDDYTGEDVVHLTSTAYRDYNCDDRTFDVKDTAER